MPPRKRKDEEVSNTSLESTDTKSAETPSVDLSDSIEVEFFSVHEGNRGRQPGIYLDIVERQQSEIQRAAAEDREPDLENPPANAGTPLVPKGVLDTIVSPSFVGNTSEQLEEPQPVSTLSVDTTDSAGSVSAVGATGGFPQADAAVAADLVTPNDPDVTAENPNGNSDTDF